MQYVCRDCGRLYTLPHGDILIEKGSAEEVAIRAASLVVAQEISESLAKKGYDIHAAHMDAYLWLEGRKAVTHHRTKTMAY